MGGRLVHWELPAKDADRAQTFYEDLFGWSFQSWDGPMDYRMTRASGDPGGAIFPSQSGDVGPIVYFDTDDVDATVARIRELGGQADDKAPIPGVGWFARAHDPEGNSISVFQADESAQMPNG